MYSWVNTTYESRRWASLSEQRLHHNYIPTEVWTYETDNLRIEIKKYTVHELPERSKKDVWSLSCHGSHGGVVIHTSHDLDTCSVEEAQNKALDYIRNKIKSLSDELQPKVRVFCEACSQPLGDIENNRYFEMKMVTTCKGFQERTNLGSVLCAACAIVRFSL